MFYIANTLKRILQNRHKLLLTATPLQNSLLELFGLVSFIDDSRSEQLSRRKRRLRDERNFVGCVGFHSSTQPTDPCTELISAKFLRRGFANESLAISRVFARSLLS
jgi:SNF2-related domain